MTEEEKELIKLQILEEIKKCIGEAVADAIKLHRLECPYGKKLERVGWAFIGAFVFGAVMGFGGASELLNLVKNIFTAGG